MRKRDHDQIPFVPVEMDFCRLPKEQNSFDPMGSYTGRTPDRDETPVQDADDL